MTNKELEKLFQSKLGSRKVDFNPSSWEGMERLLDSKMPIRPWYLPFAAWIKGLTAAMIIGFAAYFIIGKPFDGYTKAGAPSEVINLNSPDNSASNTRSSQFERVNSTNQSASYGNSRFSNPSKIQGASKSTNGFNNGSNANGYAYVDGNGPGKKTKRKDRKRNRQKLNTIPSTEDRFVQSDQLNTKPTPVLEFDYAELSLVMGAENQNQKSFKKDASSSSPLKFGATFSAIASRDLLPQAEGTLNTGLKPAFAFGLVLAQPLDENWGISAGLNYKWQKANTSNTTHEVNYSFGEEHIYTTLNYRSINNIEIPVSAFYRFADRHQINFGLYASYLWAANVKYNIETIKSFGSEKESGQLFNNSYIKDVWDYGVTAGYYYSINSKFQVGVDSWFGLTPLQYSPDYDLKANNFQLRFSLNYWLF